MNRKKQAWTLAALLGLLLLAITCGSALAAPVFYVRIDNQTDNPVHVHYYWTTRAGANATEPKAHVIPPHGTTMFNGNPGLGRMTVWTQTKGEDGPCKRYIDGDTDPQGWNAHLYIKYNEAGFLRIYKPEG